MRKAVLGLALLSLMTLVSPSAQAEKKTISYNKANLSCAVACPYWLDDGNTDLNGDGNPDIYFDACDMPFPGTSSGELSWEDKVVTAPSTADFVQFIINPLLDWDSFICAPDGETLAIGANIIGQNCDNFLGPDNPVEEGCIEDTIIPVVPSKTYHLRVYLWGDLPGSVAPLSGTYEFKSL